MFYDSIILLLINAIEAGGDGTAISTRDNWVTSSPCTRQACIHGALTESSSHDVGCTILRLTVWGKVWQCILYHTAGIVLKAWAQRCYKFNREPLNAFRLPERAASREDSSFSPGDILNLCTAEKAVVLHCLLPEVFALVACLKEEFNCVLIDSTVVTLKYKMI